MSSVPISGYGLLANGWKKNGSEYLRGSDTIKYDGVHWYYNGKKLSANDYPEEIFKNQGVSFSPNIPIKKNIP